MQQLQAAITAAQQPSPYETAMANDYNNTRSWLDKKDYRNTPAGVNVDLLPAAEYQRMRGMVRGSNQNNTAAAGVINPQILQQQQELDDNQFTQDWGNAYENKVGELMGNNNMLGQSLQGQYTNRMETGIRGAGMNLDAYRNRPKQGNFWGDFLKGILPGASNLGFSALAAAI